MEMDLDPSCITGDDAPEVEYGNILGDVSFEGERCGICMDVVIDRGVLDCCQHWYCFTCIDNWASITNLCPLCQNEFQLITSVPVYDTIGSNRVEDENLSREDAWCIEGKNDTLSFPSYYIDENAVICFDGDGCKIRNGSASIEDPGLDTSIACDSCDIWYHAFCADFDPEGTSENTWLCPRCVVDKVPVDTKMDNMHGAVSHSGPGHANNLCQFDDSFRKVSVSVADSGETALVISMHGALDGPKMSSENALPSPQIDNDHMTESLFPVPNGEDKDAGMSPVIVSPDIEEHELSLLQKSSIVPSDCLAHTKSNPTGPEADKSSEFNGVLNASAKFSSECKQLPGHSESELSFHLGSTVASFLSDDDMHKGAEDCVTVVQEGNPSEELFRGNRKILDVDKNAEVIGEKRKHVSSNQVCLNNGDMIRDVATEVSVKKPEFEGSTLTTSADHNDALVLGMSSGNPSHEDEKLKPFPKKVEITPDVMRIVKGTNRRRSKLLASSNACNLSTKECETVAGFRLKKIMRRAAVDEDSSILVQNLRKEIREAVQKKSNKFEENVFDPKLLAAFRAAMGGPTSQPVNKLSTSALKSKKLMLQKGKVRENLTKKIYGNSNGKRKRAWDRDCEVEFWKYRCTSASKPEKIETLKSVLHLLHKSSESLELKQESEYETTYPILNRLYLADTSIFPRKDDVLPLTAVATNGSLEMSRINDQGPEASFENSTSKSSVAKKVLSKMGASSPECKVNKKIESGSATKPVSEIVHPNSTMVGESVSWTSGGKGCKDESGVLSVDVKSDKRKWALQVLARRATVAAGKRAEENQQNNTLFKGNYPLLAQLPADMKPILATTSHNKIPVSVRQTQLYRLTEHFLRNANLAEICRTAETELAVADAVNIEKNAADRSNSKLVYINLCAQELLHRWSKSNLDQATDMNPSSLGSLSERSEQHIDELPFNPTVEEALKNAGLLSDSPPTSPIAKSETDNDATYPSGFGNLLDMDSHPELDIYGDFEYELEGEDYIGASTAVLNQQSESVPKMKVLFSTVNVNKLSTDVHAMESEGLGNCDIRTNTDDGSFTIDGEPGKSVVLAEVLPGAGAQEPSDVECRELYGPDKEPSLNDSRHWQHVTPCIATQATDPCENEDAKLAESCSAAIISPNSSGVEISHISPRAGENVGGEGNKSDPSKHSECVNFVSKKVEAYIKEHVRPLCKSGVITVEQYRWAVNKTTEKVMKYHSKSKNANFLIKEGEKVKKLAEQYVEASQQNSS